MMLLSRFWYAILAVALAASIGLLYISIHEHNRLRATDTYEIVSHDRDVVDWFLQLDARRRLDALAIVSVDSAVQDGLVKANGQEKIDAGVREALKKRLNELALRVATLARDEGKGGQNPVMLFAVDAHGRVAASVNFDRQNLVKDETFEMGGHPAVVDALHGWLRDDTWVLDREGVYRVVVRPVVKQADAPPIGAVLALRRVDDTYAKLVSEKTGSPVAFYVIPPDGNAAIVVGREAPEKTGVSFDGFTIDPKQLEGDKFYNSDNGASSLKTEKDRSTIYSRIVGGAWDLGAGYAVVRKVTTIADPGALLQGANEDDKKAVPIPLVAGVGLGALLLGILFTLFEHSRPLSALSREAKKYAKGEQDTLPLAKLSGDYRKIAQDVNEATERVISKGGGASRKAADLEQILGPVPAAPQMSAFSFNFDGNAPQAPGAPTSKPGGAGNDLFPNLPPAGLGAPASTPKPATPPQAPVQRPQAPAAPAAPVPQSPQALAQANDEDDEATQVARIPEELMRAATTGEQQMIDNADELIAWRKTFDEFVEMRKKCGEATTGLSFEKFQGQLRKNKEQLVKQYNCKRVRFTVYEKDGKAALKATPIKEG